MIQLCFPSKSPLLPEFNINLFNTTIEESIRKQLIDIVLAEELNILAIPTKLDSDSNWLTVRLFDYNFLDFEYECIKDFNNFIYTNYKQYMSDIGVDTNNPVYITCWANIMRNGGRTITPHHHGNLHGMAPYQYSYVSGNICIDTQETSTFFAHPLFASAYKEIPNKEIPNKNGEMIMFPSFITHWASENKNERPRITIAFDIITQEVYNMLGADTKYKLLTLK